ncbi:MAG: hypothetical protein CMC15_17455 [Flavobacteriaceae bacterium]|nr:hypothetical protein [Flavobacteriaceae bacterium]|tara:strand:- start:327 stop:623 length:297 start_codon:yes stop_codon:yes gene_type:complete
MKKMTITKINVSSAANFLGLLGVATGAIKGVVLPVLALIGAGALGDVDGGIDKISAAVSTDLGSIAAFGIGGWVGGAVYAWIANWVLHFTKGLTIETK